MSYKNLNPRFKSRHPAGVDGVELALARHQLIQERDVSRAGQRRNDSRYQRERRRALEREV